ncbi:group 1 truncated hemoglobin [Solwaraspora sp. WMMD1047]|uniref:group I truncated hemoglobin n=1 Tax=Solwaraspora sp. WMMD1047 TaxID=3016102 RepID=UPI00241705B7|nr:group 1 truncated hemoglobin [Solwaraspora sp. WMMD1047]MDG4831032.1 group 1 truncated hemoglobin [Solwaraspora sp. WMMD1047]
MTDIEAANAPVQEGDPGVVAGASYYQRVGGAEAVKAAVGLFYDKVLADPELAGYFAAVDMEQQRRHLALMLTVVLGGPDGYSGRGLAEAHQPLGIPPEHYALVGEHLMATLSELGAPADVLAHVGDVLVQVRDQVVGAGDRRGG